MIGRDAIQQILDQYAKHGWKLRRVLLSAPLRDRLPERDEIFPGVDVRPSDLDALWFSRSSRPGITAWELRHLSTAPYALVENIFDETDAADAELALKRTETKMIEVVRERITGH